MWRHEIGEDTAENVAHCMIDFRSAVRIPSQKEKCDARQSTNQRKQYQVSESRHR
jgi:hypothetical protein